jgi:hypothetical protein
MPCDDFGDDRAQHRALAHAILIGLVGGILQKIRAAKCSQKRRHWPSLVSPTKICSPSAVSNGS